MIPLANKLKPNLGRPAIDVYSTLKTLTYKGVEMPAQSASWQLGKRVIEHSLSYHRGVITHNMGSDSQRFVYYVPLFQNMLNPKWGNAFTNIWPKLLAKLKEDTKGPLVDPMFGEIPEVEFTRGSYSLDNDKGRGGILLQLEFVESTKITTDEAIQELTLDAAKLGAKDFGTRFGKLFVEQQDLTGDSPFSILNAPGLIASKVFRVVNKIEATRDKFISKINRQVGQIEQVGDPRNLPTARLGKDLARRAANLGPMQFSQKRKKMRVHQVTTSITVIQLCSDLGITQEKLFEKNPKLSESPTVQAGTVVVYQVD